MHKYILYKILDVITYPWPNLSKSVLVKGAQDRFSLLQWPTILNISSCTCTNICTWSSNKNCYVLFSFGEKCQFSYIQYPNLVIIVHVYILRPYSARSAAGTILTTNLDMLFTTFLYLSLSIITIGCLDDIIQMADEFWETWWLLNY